MKNIFPSKIEFYTRVDVQAKHFKEEERRKNNF